MLQSTRLRRTFHALLLAAAGLLTATAVPAQDSDDAGNGQSASSGDTELAERHYRRGNTYSNIDRHEDAIREYRLSITADPEFADSYRGLANIYYSQGRYEEAIPMLSEFVKRFADDAGAPMIAALGTLGELLRETGRYEEAIEIDLRAMNASPDDHSQVFLLGNAYYNAGHTGKAIRIYRKALENFPEDAFIHRTLGRMHDDQGRLEQALEHYRRASELDEGSDFYRELVRDTEEALETRDADDR